MNLLQRQHHPQIHIIVDDSDVKGVRPLSFPSDSSLRTLHNDDFEMSSGLNPKMKGDITDEYAGEPPDGGLKAWSVVLASCLTTCAAFGYLTSWGIFQAYYQEVMLRNENTSDIAWIGSVQLGLVFFPGLVTGRLLDLGYLKMPHFFASCFLILFTFLVAECKVYWQFFLVQGLGIGLASGILFGPTLGIIPQWFSKRRGLAMGVCAIGSSVGGTVFPIAAQNLIPEVGFKWTMRIFGLILIVLLGVANLMTDRRLPPVKARGGLFNLAALRNPAYTVYCISGIIAFLGMYTVLIYIPISTIQVGIASDFAFYLAAIANATSIIGRILVGFLADRVGVLNVMIPFTVVVAATTVVWPFIRSKGALIGISMVYGFAYGTYVSLVCAPVMAMGSTNDVGQRVGLFLSFIGFGALVGTPISGAINSATGGFEYVGWYAGGVLLFSVCLLLLVRHLDLGKFRGKF